MEGTIGQEIAPVNPFYLTFGRDLALMDDGLRKKLKEIRDSGGFGTIEDAAKKLGVSRRTVGDYERGHRLPDIDYLANFSEQTGADLEELLALRLVAGGHKRPAMSVRDRPLEYHVPPDLAALRSRLMVSVMPMEWALYLTELVLRGKISEAAAEEIADFWDNWQPSINWLHSMEEDRR